MKNILLLFFPVCLLLLLASCGGESTRTNALTSARTAKVEQVAREYFTTYAERRNWDKLLSFYRYDMQFEDVMLQIKLFNRDDFASFYNWPGADFRKAAPDQPHLVLQNLMVNDSVAVGRGYFLPFFLDGQYNDWRWGSEFTIWLFFDEQLKIKRQMDMIEYPDWVLEEVILGYRRSVRGQ